MVCIWNIFPNVDKNKASSLANISPFIPPISHCNIFRPLHVAIITRYINIQCFKPHFNNCGNPEFFTQYKILFNHYSTHPIVITDKLYWNNPSLTTKYLPFSEFSILHNMLWLTWPSSSNTRIENTLEDICNIKFCKKKWQLMFTLRIIIYKSLC